MWLWTTSAPSTPAAIARSIDIACSAASCGAAPPSASQARCATTPGASRSAPQQCTLDVDQPRQLARQVLDVHPGPAVDLGRVLAREQRDLHRCLDDGALADHDDPVVGDREALAVGLQVDADLRARVT